MFINKKTGASYGFVAPEISEDAGKDIKMQFPTFGSVEARKVVDHLEADVKRTHTVVTLGEIDTLEKIDTKIDMLGKIPVIPLVAKPNENLPDGSRLTVLLDPNLESYPRTTIKGFNEESEEEPVENPEKKDSKFKLGLVALALSASEETEAPAFVCVIPSVASLFSDFAAISRDAIKEEFDEDSEMDFRANLLPVNFTLMSGQWVPAETIVGLASVQTTVGGYNELVDRIESVLEDNGTTDDEGGDDNGTTGNEGGDDNGTTDNEGGGNDDPTDNEGGGNDDPTDNEGSGNDDPTDNEGGGNDDPTGNEGGDNDDPNNGGEH